LSASAAAFRRCGDAALFAVSHLLSHHARHHPYAPPLYLRSGEQNDTLVGDGGNDYDVYKIDVGGFTVRLAIDTDIQA